MKRFRGDSELMCKGMTEYREVVGRINWLAQNMRLEIAIEACVFSKKFIKETASDIRGMIKVIKKMEKITQ